MARISVEQKALTDPRFAYLGLLILGEETETSTAVHHALGLALMIRVWNECQERSCHALHAVTLCGIASVMGLSDRSIFAWIKEAELGDDPENTGYLRIRGTDGRVEWLGKSRDSNRERQKLYRSRNALVTRDKPVTNALVTPLSQGAPALALSPALAPKTTTTTSSNPPSEELDAHSRVKPAKRNGYDPELVRLFDLFYSDYPRHEGKQAALKAFIKLAPDQVVLLAIADDMDARVNDGRWLPDDQERCKFIPLPASYLNGRRWEDGLS